MTLNIQGHKELKDSLFSGFKVRTCLIDTDTMRQHYMLFYIKHFTWLFHFWCF